MITPRGMRILDALDALGEKTGATPAQLSLAWLRAKGCVPIASATSLQQLEELAVSAEIELQAADIAALDEASRTDPGEGPDRGPMPGS
jgi:aryl-alcohol dehydrogenase-like predicted oxidoreductase